MADTLTTEKVEEKENAMVAEEKQEKPVQTAEFILENTKEETPVMHLPGGIEMKGFKALPKLQKVQAGLHVPKGQDNNFGNYKYRSVEDILRVAVPLLDKVGATVLIVDKPVPFGDKMAIEATAILADSDSGDYVSTHAFAIMDAHKGMSLEQMTGTTSSYARKYALSALLAVNNGEKDPDEEPRREQDAKPPAPAKQPAKAAPKQEPAKQEPVKQESAYKSFQEAFDDYCKLVEQPADKVEAALAPSLKDMTEEQKTAHVASLIVKTKRKRAAK